MSNQELFHELTPRSKNHKKVSLFFDLQLVQKGHTATRIFGGNECLLGVWISLDAVRANSGHFAVQIVMSAVLPKRAFGTGRSRGFA